MGLQIIAMLARYTKGIKDCDVGSPSLCVHGADFVREHEGLILRVRAPPWPAASATCDARILPTHRG